MQTSIKLKIIDQRVISKASHLGAFLIEQHLDTILKSSVAMA
jgi:hypothetical protein